MMKNPNFNFGGNFKKGPTGDLPLEPEHGGPILSLDVYDDIVVTSSTDHGARVYNLISGKQIKELFAKRYGHAEWVTCVKILQDGRIVTGGMDSKLCVWDAKALKCVDLTEHSGSISKIQTDYNGLLLSSAYDTSIRIYNIDQYQCLGVMSGYHKKPVTEFNWRNSLCASADRDGNVALWDVNSQKCIKALGSLHQGQISNIVFHTDDMDTNLILTSGINDGVINGIDMRTGERVLSKQVKVFT